MIEVDITQKKTGGPGAQLWGGVLRLTSHSRRAAFAALTRALTSGGRGCVSAWSLSDIQPPRPPRGLEDLRLEQ